MNHPAIKSIYPQFSVLKKDYFEPVFKPRDMGGNPAATEYIIYKNNAAVGSTNLAIAVLLAKKKYQNYSTRIDTDSQIDNLRLNLKQLTARIR